MAEVAALAPLLAGLRPLPTLDMKELQSPCDKSGLQEFVGYGHRTAVGACSSPTRAQAVSGLLRPEQLRPSKDVTSAIPKSCRPKSKI